MDGRGRQLVGVFIVTGVVVAAVWLVGVGVPPSATAPETYRPTASATLTTPTYVDSSRQPTTARSSRPRPTLAVDTGCRQAGKGSAALPEIDPHTSDRVNRAWERIETWLAAHAPATAETLNPPASPRRIAEAQVALGVELPAELVASLRRHNGARIDKLDVTFALPPFHTPMATERLVSDWQGKCRVLGSSDDDEDVGEWWHGRFVPFAETFMGDSLFLDQRPGQRGRLGEADHQAGVSFDDTQPQLIDLLEQTADVLDGRGPLLQRYRPQVTENRSLEWEIVR